MFFIWLQKFFGDEYYGGEEEEKPQFDDDDEIEGKSWVCWGESALCRSWSISLQRGFMGFDFFAGCSCIWPVRYGTFAAEHWNWDTWTGEEQEEAGDEEEYDDGEACDASGPHCEDEDFIVSLRCFLFVCVFVL